MSTIGKSRKLDGQEQFQALREHVLSAAAQVVAELRFAQQPSGLVSVRALRAIFDLVIQDLVSAKRIEFPNLEDPGLLRAASRLPHVKALREYVAQLELIGAGTSDLLPLCFESVYGLDIDLGEASLSSRREHGVYFTPAALAKEVVAATLSPLLTLGTGKAAFKKIRLIDPSAGGGVFLVESARLVGKWLSQNTRNPAACQHALTEFIEDCIYGLDIDDLAVHVAVAALLVDNAKLPVSVDRVRDHIKTADALLPNSLGSDVGFDFVIGNPPWGRLRPDAKRFLSAARPLQGPQKYGKQLIEERWEQFVRRCDAYVRRLDSTELYRHRISHPSGPSVRGDADLYKYFMERALQLIGPGGRIGLVIPSGFLRSASAYVLRSMYFDRGTIERLVEFENRARLFPIHGMFRYAVMVFQEGPKRGVASASFRQTKPPSVCGSSSTISLSHAFLQRSTGSLLLIPELISETEKGVFESLRRSWPSLGTSHPAWNVRFKRELDMTVDRRHFVPREALQRSGMVARSDGTATSGGRTYLPLYEGRMVHQFDCAAKGYVSGEGRSAVWQVFDESQKAISPHFFVDIQHCAPDDYEQTRAGFCDVTGHANERTVLAALIPSNAICGNKVPTCRFDKDDKRLHCLWTGIANSFVVDWLVRRLISTTLNFFILESIPFPRIAADTVAARRIALRVARLSDTAPRLTDLSQRAGLRAEIDAEVGLLYGLTLSQFACILQDFPLLDRAQRPLPGERRSTATRDLVLTTYARILKSHRQHALLDAPEIVRVADIRTTGARQHGAIAYL